MTPDFNTFRKDFEHLGASRPYDLIRAQDPFAWYKTTVSRALSRLTKPYVWSAAATYLHRASSEPG